jgi:uncharacterized protein (DUF4415 family)
MKKEKFKEFDFENSRRITPEEQEMYRRAIEKKLGVPRPSRGRPPKLEEDKFAPVYIRLHPTILTWAKKEAKKKKIGYQTLINKVLFDIATHK